MRDEVPEVSVEGLGWARGPVRDACVESGEMVGTGRSPSSGVGGPGGLPAPASGSAGALASGPASCPS